MHRLTMYKSHFSIVYVIICKLFIVSCGYEHRNSSSSSALGFLVDRDGRDDVIQTTEAFGIIIKSNRPITTAVPTNNLWSKIDNSRTTPPYHATRTSNNTPVKKVDFETSVVDGLMNWANRSLNYLNATVPQKEVKGKNEGHAFFDDDDDYEDDDDDYDDEDEEYKKGSEDVVDEVEEAEPVAEAAADDVEGEPQEEYENYAESSKRPIVLRTRWKSKRKHGKKHGHIKIKHFKKLKKFMLPLLLAYKLKFFTLVPLLLGGLVLIVATTGFAGFFFALFAVGLGLKTGHH